MAKSDKERKADQAAREKDALQRLGGRRLSFVAYGATLTRLEEICVAQGFTGRQRYAEALTFLIHSNKL